MAKNRTKQNKQAKDTQRKAETDAEEVQDGKPKETVNEEKASVISKNVQSKENFQKSKTDNKKVENITKNSNSTKDKQKRSAENKKLVKAQNLLTKIIKEIKTRYLKSKKTFFDEMAELENADSSLDKVITQIINLHLSGINVKNHIIYIVVETSKKIPKFSTFNYINPVNFANFMKHVDREVGKSDQRVNRTELNNYYWFMKARETTGIDKLESIDAAMPSDAYKSLVMLKNVEKELTKRKKQAQEELEENYLACNQHRIEMRETNDMLDCVNKIERERACMDQLRTERKMLVEEVKKSSELFEQMMKYEKERRDKGQDETLEDFLNTKLKCVSNDINKLRISLNQAKTEKENLSGLIGEGRTKIESMRKSLKEFDNVEDSVLYKNIAEENRRLQQELDERQEKERALKKKGEALGALEQEQQRCEKMQAETGRELSQTIQALKLQVELLEDKEREGDDNFQARIEDVNVRLHVAWKRARKHYNAIAPYNEESVRAYRVETETILEENKMLTRKILDMADEIHRQKRQQQQTVTPPPQNNNDDFNTNHDNSGDLNSDHQTTAINSCNHG